MLEVCEEEGQFWPASHKECYIYNKLDMIIYQAVIKGKRRVSRLAC